MKNLLQLFVNKAGSLALILAPSERLAPVLVKPSLPAAGAGLNVGLAARRPSRWSSRAGSSRFLSRADRGIALALALGLAGWTLPAADDAATNKAAEAEITTNTAPAAIEQTSGPTNEEGRWSRAKEQLQRPARSNGPLVMFGEDAVLKAGESAEVVVAIGGNAVVDGSVQAAVVAVGGSVKITGEVRDAVVAVLGNVELGTNAHVHGDVVSVGGHVTRAEGALVEGHVQSVPFPGFDLPDLKWLRDWIVQCVFKLRPLAPQVAWVWVVAAVFLLAYLLIGVVFARPVAACVRATEQRPATTFFVGLLTLFLFPVVSLILGATGVGLLVVPFLLAALFFAVFVGKVALFEFIGLGLGRQFKVPVLEIPLVTLLVGWVILTLLYMVPFLGLAVFAVSALWGLGIATTAFFASFRREMPERTPPPSPGLGTPLSPTPTPTPPCAPDTAAPSLAMPLVAGAPSGDWAGNPPVIGASTCAPLAAPVMAPGAAELLALPRAGFWERMGAGVLDIVIIAIATNVVPIPMGFGLFSLAYFAGMWFWKGTTVGGILLKLQVIRTDARPITWQVSLVRALAAAFSAVVLFLGFFWIAWDREREGWHDKIAGTAVVKLPKAMPLLVI